MFHYVGDIYRLVQFQKTLQYSCLHHFKPLLNLERDFKPPTIRLSAVVIHARVHPRTVLSHSGCCVY